MTPFSNRKPPGGAAGFKPRVALLRTALGC